MNNMNTMKGLKIANLMICYNVPLMKKLKHLYSGNYIFHCKLLK